MDGYNCIQDYHDGIYECDFVSPYSKSAHNINSEVMFFLQDWSSDSSLSGEIDRDSVEFGFTRNKPTNQNLIKLIENHYSLSLNQVYISNLFPFIKLGQMSATIKRSDMLLATKGFGYPQIEIIRPKIVICLGLITFNAFRALFGLNIAKTLSEGIISNFTYNGIFYFCQSHPGMLGKNNRNKGGIDRVTSDWERMVSIFNNK